MSHHILIEDDLILLKRVLVDYLDLIYAIPSIPEREYSEDDIQDLIETVENSIEFKRRSR